VLYWSRQSKAVEETPPWQNYIHNLTKKWMMQLDILRLAFGDIMAPILM
jgi:hypothetical protein